MWVKFKKGHPKFAYFVGDVADISKTDVDEYKLLDGYVINADESEINAAKKAIEDEKTQKAKEASETGGVDATLAIVEQQRKEIADLKAQLAGPKK